MPKLASRLHSQNRLATTLRTFALVVLGLAAVMMSSQEARAGECSYNVSNMKIEAPQYFSSSLSPIRVILSADFNFSVSADNKGLCDRGEFDLFSVAVNGVSRYMCLLNGPSATEFGGGTTLTKNFSCHFDVVPVPSFAEPNAMFLTGEYGLVATTPEVRRVTRKTQQSITIGDLSGRVGDRISVLAQGGHPLSPSSSLHLRPRFANSTVTANWS